jgi:hypothetical protein
MTTGGRSLLRWTREEVAAWQGDAEVGLYKQQQPHSLYIAVTFSV